MSVELEHVRGFGDGYRLRANIYNVNTISIISTRKIIDAAVLTRLVCYQKESCGLLSTVVKATREEIFAHKLRLQMMNQQSD